MSAGADVRRTRRREPTRTPRAATAVERNALITHTAAAVLTILLLAEGLTLLNMHGLLHAHMFIGLVLIPPVLLKLGEHGLPIRALLHRRARLPGEGATAPAAARSSHRCSWRPPR